MFFYSPAGEEQYKYVDRQKSVPWKNNTSLACCTLTFSHDQFSSEELWRCTWVQVQGCGFILSYLRESFVCGLRLNQMLLWSTQCPRFLIQTWIVREVDANSNAELLVLHVCVLTLLSWVFLIGNKNGTFLQQWKAQIFKSQWRQGNSSLT